MTNATGLAGATFVRALAYKWIRIFFRRWYDRVAYSGQRYEEALRTRAAHAQPAQADSKVDSR